MKNNLLVTLAILIIFSTYFILEPLGEGSGYLSKNLLIPLFWLLFFIYFLRKNLELIVINSYLLFLLFLLAEKLNFGPISFNEVVIYTMLIMLMTLVFVFIYQELFFLKKFNVAFIFCYGIALSIYIIPIFFVIYTLNYETKVTKDILYALFQTNSNESIEFIINFVSKKLIALFIVTTSLMGLLLFVQGRKKIKKTNRSLVTPIIVILSVLLFIEIRELKLPMFVWKNLNKYRTELNYFTKIQEQRKAGEIKFEATKKKKDETYIVIIGESLNKKNMGLYGYLRDTTPNLSRMNKSGNLIVFKNVYSCHTHTVPVLSLALTEANQINDKSYFESLSIIDILNQAKIKTYWLTNQTLLGSWDNMVSVLAHQADSLVGINHSIGKQAETQKFDGQLIEEVKKILKKKSDMTRVIFVHLMGNHWTYSNRYPQKDYNIFVDSLKRGNFGNLVDIKGINESINSYDNSIVYNDYVVSTILKMLHKLKGSTGLIYMPDHADDVLGNKGHHVGRFTYEMTQIPLIAWFSNEYKNLYPQKYSIFKNNTNTLYSNDFFYDTLLGLFDVKTNKYDEKFDLSSINYQLDEEDAFTIHGEKLYTDSSNYIWWQKKNAEYIINTNQSLRVFPHRVNSIGKLKDIWDNGIRSFEMDVHFRINKTNTFTVGHNIGVMGESLENFLLSVNYDHIERVWLDFKNLNENNYKSAKERLEFLDIKFNIKNKFIIESSTTLPFFQEFKKSGWNTSYYIPTEKIMDLLNKNKTNKMSQLAIKIAAQCKNQFISSVSFDRRLYPFIKQYLEPLISSKIVYRSWYGPAMYKKTFKVELLKNELFLDERVETILVEYKSQFHL